MKPLYFLALMALSLPAFSQVKFTSFQWQPTARLHEVDAAYRNAAAVMITDRRVVEYAFDKEDLFIYRTMHRIVHINSDKGIESFNKIYLPFDEGIEMIDVKARTVLPNGKVIELNKSNIKDIKDEDGQYKIFALEGLTKGCEVEYYFTIRKNPSFFGREIISSKVPAQQVEFELIAPEHLFFEARSFNNLPAAKDTTYGEKRHLLICGEKIPEANEERYSMYQASLKRVEYKLCYNLSRNAKTRLFTWDELAKKAHMAYTTMSDKDSRKLKDWLSEVPLKGLTTEPDRIAAIENFVKKNIMTRDDLPDEDAADLAKVIKNKVASHDAFTKIMLGLYNAAGIETQVVLPGNRSDYTIERNFENWNNTRNVLFYFPNTGKYLAPTEIEYRYPFIPPTWGATNALHCVSTTIGNFTTAIGEVRPVTMEAYEHSYLNMDVSMKMHKDDTLMMEVAQYYGGYAAPNYRGAFNFMPAEDQRNFMKEMVKFGTNSENMVSSSVENKELEMKDPYLPFIIKATVKSTNLVERAGDKIMIKIGEVIGEQAQLYETKDRTTLIDVGFAHSLVRKIRFTIPAGYRVKNLNDLNFNATQTENGQVTMGFVSSYEVKGNELILTIQEDYKKVNYPVEQYEVFKKVINAAADFNKVVLILDKI